MEKLIGKTKKSLIIEKDGEVVHRMAVAAKKHIITYDVKTKKRGR